MNPKIVVMRKKVKDWKAGLIPVIDEPEYPCDNDAEIIRKAVKHKIMSYKTTKAICDMATDIWLMERGTGSGYKLLQSELKKQGILLRKI